ncbi:MAG: hypothetical protein V2I26_07990 [Halieaceae bacterium]|jgi:hypothetical protein|nr:hypothetical protein [Halieaceae bacterium]
MGDVDQRSTFLPLSDILAGAAKHCLVAEADLIVTAGHASNPVSLAWSEIASQEHELAKLILNFASTGPVELLDTRFQYSPEQVEMDRPGSPEQAVAQLVNVNHQLTDSLDELCVNLAATELARELDQLRRAVESMAQRISMISTTMSDV